MDITHQQVSHLAGHADAAQIQQHDVVVGAAAHHGDAALLDALGEGLGVGNHLLAVNAEAGL